MARRKKKKKQPRRKVSGAGDASDDEDCAPSETLTLNPTLNPGPADLLAAAREAAEEGLLKKEHSAASCRPAGEGDQTIGGMSRGDENGRAVEVPNDEELSAAAQVLLSAIIFSHLHTLHQLYSTDRVSGHPSLQQGAIGIGLIISNVNAWIIQITILQIEARKQLEEVISSVSNLLENSSDDSEALEVIGS